MEKDTHQYETGSWRSDDSALSREAYLTSQLQEFDTGDRDVRDRSRLLHLLGLINYRILTGKRVYVEAGGIVYRPLYGGYWRSVFTGVEHYLLRCEEISGGMWTEGGTSAGTIDLPITHTKEGWTASGHSLMFMLHRD